MTAISSGAVSSGAVSVATVSCMETGGSVCSSMAVSASISSIKSPLRIDGRVEVGLKCSLMGSPTLPGEYVLF